VVVAEVVSKVIFPSKRISDSLANGVVACECFPSRSRMDIGIMTLKICRPLEDFVIASTWVLAGELVSFGIPIAIVSITTSVALNLMIEGETTHLLWSIQV
jgi:hypothetical protein